MTQLGERNSSLQHQLQLPLQRPLERSLLKVLKMATRGGAKAVETAKNRGDTANILKHKGHELRNGETGRPHYQTEGSSGHTFWGTMAAVGSGLTEAIEASKDEIWKDIKSDPLGEICWICSAGNESNDSDVVPESNPAVEAARRYQAEKDARCGISCGIKQEPIGRRERDTPF